MSKKPRDNRPYLPPIKRIELSEGNIRMRWILLAALVVIAVVSIGYGMNSAMNVQPGWSEVSAISDQPNCSSAFKLMYDFSENGGNAAAVNKKLIEVYSKACEEAFALLSADIEKENIHNVRYLNAHINTPVSVEPFLYRSLELLEQHKNRSLFLAPVYVEYNRVFLSSSDGEAALYDPQKNPEVGEYVQTVMRYVSDPQNIRLELLGENQVLLNVSEEYQQFAEEYGIESYLDFGWLQNAFIADYLAEVLMEQGLTSGYLVSYDGFTRNLDDRGNSYSVNFFDRVENTIYLPAQITYSGARSIVFLRDYPMTEQDQWHYYAYEDGSISSVLLNPQSGLSAASVDSWMTVSDQEGCVSMLLKMLDCYFADAFSLEAVEKLQEQGIGSLWCEDRTVHSNIFDAEVAVLDTGVESGYHLELLK